MNSIIILRALFIVKGVSTCFGACNIRAAMARKVRKIIVVICPKRNNYSIGVHVAIVYYIYIQLPIQFFVPRPYIY